MYPTYNWLGQPFTVFPSNLPYPDLPGIYIMAEELITEYRAHYVGQATSFADRLSGHTKLPAARARSATSLHFLHVPRQEDRNFLERHLIEVLQPHLNEQLKGSGSALESTGYGLLDSALGLAATGGAGKGLLNDFAVGLAAPRESGRGLLDWTKWQ